MPNHIHLLLHVSGRSPELSKLVFNGKRFLAYQIVKQLREDGNDQLLRFFSENKTKEKAKHKVFEPRYDSLIIQTEKFFLEKLNYIHGNPCQEKWRLAKEPEDYIYSSASNYVSGRGIYDTDLVDF